MNSIRSRTVQSCKLELLIAVLKMTLGDTADNFFFFLDGQIQPLVSATDNQGPEAVSNSITVVSIGQQAKDCN